MEIQEAGSVPWSPPSRGAGDGETQGTVCVHLGEDMNSLVPYPNRYGIPKCIDTLITIVFNVHLLYIHNIFKDYWNCNTCIIPMC